MSPFSLKTLAMALCFVAAPIYAHHGSSGQFDTEKNIEVSGIVTEVKFVNPHSYVYFDVTNADGSVDNWRCEMRAGSLLRRTGWTTDMFATGTRITIAGSPARREPFGCLTKTVTFEDGESVERYDVIGDDKSKQKVEVAATLKDGTPNLNGNWVALPRPMPAGGPPPGRDPETAGDNARPGPPGGGRRGPQYSLTELGMKASEGFVREDNPRYHCQTTNIFLDWTFDQHVNKIEQTSDAVVMTYGFMGNPVRTIHLNMDSHPAQIEPSRVGHSIGSWQDGVLVVDTVGFTAGYLDGTFSGTKHSAKMNVVERFSLSEDGNTLNREFVVEDELYLSEKFEGKDSVVRSAANFESYDCEDLTEEVVEGF